MQEVDKSNTLSRLLDVTRTLAASADLTEVLTTIINAMRDLLESDRASVFQYEPKTKELCLNVGHSDDGKPLIIRLPISSGIAGACASTREIINVPDAYEDERFNQSFDKKTGYRTRSILAIPLVDHEDELQGVAQVINRFDGPFGPEQEEIATALAAQCAVTLKRARLMEDRMRRLHVERDLEIARKIQMELMPPSKPAFPGWDIYGWTEPAEETGGDIFDFVSNDNELVFLMGDATGHGVGPAISVVQVRTALRMALDLNADFTDSVLKLNRQSKADLPSGRFVTAYFGKIKKGTNVIEQISCGQAPILILRKNGNHEVIDADTIPLGIMDPLIDLEKPIEFSFEPGDALVLASDGFFEAPRADDEQMGNDRVIEAAAACLDEGSEAIAENIRKETLKFTGGLPQNDDQTIVIARFHGDFTEPSPEEDD